MVEPTTEQSREPSEGAIDNNGIHLLDMIMDADDDDWNRWADEFNDNPFG